jgi:hypothetical protein
MRDISVELRRMKMEAEYGSIEEAVRSTEESSAEQVMNRSDSGDRNIQDARGAIVRYNEDTERGAESGFSSLGRMNRRVYEELYGEEVGMRRVRSRSVYLDEVKKRSIKTIRHFEVLRVGDIVSGSLLSDFEIVGKDAVERQYVSTKNMLPVGLHGTGLIVSDKDMVSPTKVCSQMVTGEVDVRLWIDRAEATMTTVHCDKEPSEIVHLSGTATKLVSFRNTGVKMIYETLKVSKKDVEEATSAEIETVIDGLTTAFIEQSRLARLVRAYIYYFALGTRRNCETRFPLAMDNTRVRVYGWDTVAAESISQNTAYVYCNDARDINYIFFLYIISKRFGIAPRILQNVLGGNDVVFRQVLMDIPDEADELVIVLNEIGDWRHEHGNRILYYDHKTWHAYIIQYARSVQLENRLSEAKAMAMCMIYGDYLPSIHLERQVSMCELYMGALSERQSSESVPLEDINIPQLMGAVTGNCLALLRYKDLRSNENVKQYSEGVKRKFDNRILGNDVNRHRFYTLLQDDGLVGVAAVLKSLDCINVIERDGVRENRLLNRSSIDMWLVMPKMIEDDKAVFENGLSSVFWNNVWSTGERGTPGNYIESEKRMAMLAQLGVMVNGDIRKGLVRVSNPGTERFDPGGYDQMVENLMEGNISMVRVARSMVGEVRDERIIWEGMEGSHCELIEIAKIVDTVAEVFIPYDDDIIDVCREPGVIGFEETHLVTALIKVPYMDIFVGADRANDAIVPLHREGIGIRRGTIVRGVFKPARRRRKKKR